LPIEVIAPLLAEIAGRQVVLAALGNALTARLLESRPTIAAKPHDSLKDARQLAEHFGIPESWIREQARAGKIPFERVGRYMRFRLADVEIAIAKRRERGDEAVSSGRPHLRLARSGAIRDV
jgi:excisionase family DNA binding protein